MIGQKRDEGDGFGEERSAHFVVENVMLNLFVLTSEFFEFGFEVRILQQPGINDHICLFGKSKFVTKADECDFEKIITCLKQILVQFELEGMDVELRGVDDERGVLSEVRQQPLFLAVALYDGAVKRDGVFQAPFLEPLDDGLQGTIEKNDPGLKMFVDERKILFEICHEILASGINDDGNFEDVLVDEQKTCEQREKPGRQVVDTIETDFFQVAQSDRFATTRITRDDQQLFF